MANIKTERTVLVDSDGVLADFDRRVITTMQSDFPEIPVLQTRQNHIIANDYPSHKELVDSISRKAGFFATLPLIEGAVEGWKRIMELGYEPRVCTGLLAENPTIREDKRRWLEEHFVPEFGYGVVDRLVITSKKHVETGVALIDDNPEVKTFGVAAWQQIVFDKPYNQHSLLPRLHGWSDISLGQLLHDSREIHLRSHASLY